MKLNFYPSTSLPPPPVPSIAPSIPPRPASSHASDRTHTEFLLPPVSPRRGLRRSVAPVLYLVAASILLCIPFVLPVALTHAVKALDSAMSTTEEQLINRNIPPKPINYHTTPRHTAKQAALKHVRRSQNRLSNSFKRNQVHQAATSADKLTAAPDQWMHHAVVHHGRLFISETFESHLNDHVSPHIHAVKQTLFRNTNKCAQPTSVRISLNLSPHVEGHVQLSTQCPVASTSSSVATTSCTLRPRVADIRKLHVDVREDGHYLSVVGGEMKGQRRAGWGPLAGAVHVRLDDKAQVAVRLVCGGQVWDSRLLSVKQLKDFMRTKQGSDKFHVFTYNVISSKSGSN